MKKTESDKEARADGIKVEVLKGEKSMIEWLEQLYNVSLKNGKILEDCKKVCVVPLHKEI